jgi:fused signal recognition particle receptor
MFSFFKRFKGGKAADTPQDTEATQTPAPAASETVAAVPANAPAPDRAPSASPATSPPTPAPASVSVPTPAPVPAPNASVSPASAPTSPQPSPAPPAPSAPIAKQTAAPTPAATTAPTAPIAPQPSIAATQRAATAVATEAAPASEYEFDTEEIVPPPAPEPEQKQSWLKRLRSGLSKTSAGLTGIFVRTKIDDDLYEELETALLMSDAGVEATEFLLGALREKVRAERLAEPAQVKTALRTLLVDLLKPLERSLVLGRAQPLVMMIAGVNGAGKTTSIGKLAKHLQRYEQSVLLAAGDTFRAAAREQLAIWGERNNVTVVAQESGDPAAVIFDAVSAARARKIDVVMADTAGRLPTQLHLMEELRKVKRVIGKAFEGAPHEVLLVIDANTGQNALAQVKAFDDALSLTGLIVTKLDGTAKGGILAAIARQRPVPVYFIGVGEKVEDLQPFSAEEFTDALLG